MKKYDLYLKKFKFYYYTLIMQMVPSVYPINNIHLFANNGLD